jgi:hypothetical protein
LTVLRASVDDMAFGVLSKREHPDERRSYMRKLIGVAIIAGMAATTETARAAPLGTGVSKVTVYDNETLPAPTRKLSVADITKRKASFSLTKTYKTPSGQTITGQQFLDISNKLQAAAEKGGCSLGSGKSCNFVAQDAKLTTAQLNTTAKLASYRLGLKRIQSPTVSPTPQGLPKTPNTPAPSTSTAEAKDPLGFAWTNEWGNRKTGAVYVGVEFGNGGTGSSTICGGEAYAGVYVFGNKKEVIRLESEASSANNKFEAQAELFVMGDSVWSRSGSFNLNALKFEKSFQVSKSFTYWGLVSINLKAKATGSAWIDGSIGGVAKPGEYTCSLTLTPSLKATLTGSAEVAILGYGELSAGAVGVEANVVLADVKIPVVASVSAKSTNGKVTFTESPSADMNAKFLSGSLDAYFRTTFPLDGEKIWDWDSDKFTFTLLEWDRLTYNKNLFKKTATQTL